MLYLTKKSMKCFVRRHLIKICGRSLLCPHSVIDVRTEDFVVSVFLNVTSCILCISNFGIENKDRPLRERLLIAVVPKNLLHSLMH